MKKQHTPGPFDAKEFGIKDHERIRIMSGNLVIAEVGAESRNLIPLEEARANGARIADCLTACDGINPLAVPMAIRCCEAAISYLILEPHLDKKQLLLELERTIAQARSKK